MPEPNRAKGLAGTSALDMPNRTCRYSILGSPERPKRTDHVRPVAHPDAWQPATAGDGELIDRLSRQEPWTEAQYLQLTDRSRRLLEFTDGRACATARWTWRACSTRSSNGRPWQSPAALPRGRLAALGATRRFATAPGSHRITPPVPRRTGEPIPRATPRREAPRPGSSRSRRASRRARGRRAPRRADGPAGNFSGSRSTS